jgi:hypothetical protein
MAKNHGTKAQRRKWGAKGGKIGGYRRALSLTPERRSEIARMGAAALWARVKA